MGRVYFCKYLIALALVFGCISCNGENEDQIIFPDDDNGYHSGQSTGRILEMEIALAQELSQIENVEDIFSRIQGFPENSVSTRIDDGERSNGERPKIATCAPELHSVSFGNSSVSSAVRYIPNCTRVPRCGGCCGHASLSCEPTATVTRHFQVVVVDFDITGLSYKRKEVVPIEEHTKCACGCKTKAEHCNIRQQYLPKECRCACIQDDEEIKCERNNDTKFWDDNSCVCKCRGSSECTTGSYYDHNTCSCINIRSGASRRQQVLGQEQQILSLSSVKQIPPIYTVSADDPRRKQRKDPEA